MSKFQSSFSWFSHYRSRTSQLLEARQSLIKQRRETSIQTKKQKDDLNRLMEEVRTDASKANKIITMAMKGNMSLKSIVTSTSERSSTGTMKKKKSGNRSGSDSDGGRGATHSAGDVPSHPHGDSMRFDMHEGQDPLPYISPYELNSGNNKSQKITL